MPLAPIWLFTSYPSPFDTHAPRISNHFDLRQSITRWMLKLFDRLCEYGSYSSRIRFPLS